MTGECTTTETRILDVLERNPGQRFTLESLVAQVPESSWGAVFLAVDRLSRRGAIRLGRNGFDYVVSAANSLAGCGVE
ncbi:MAG: hypothetical protein U0172_02670 [Nitrospiraceae bacterium]